MLDLDTVLAAMRALVAEVAVFVQREAGNVQSLRVEKKGYNDLVSRVDKETEELLVSGLRALVPEAGFLTEESTTSRTQDPEGLVWIIDPIDGTTNFLHGVPFFSISVALADKGIPVAGVVYDVRTGESFVARTGGGAYLYAGGSRDHGGSCARLSVSPAGSLSDSLIGTGFPYDVGTGLSRQFLVIEQLLQRSHGVRTMGSAALDLAYVAAGRFEAFFEYGLKFWDVAAALVLIEEAGGRVTDFSGRFCLPFGGSVVAGNGAIHGELIPLLHGNP